jgi:predicted esterase
MTWMRFSHGFRLDPLAEGPAEAVVVVPHVASVAVLIPVANRWAMAVPTTAFIALDGMEQLGPSSGCVPSQTPCDPDANVETNVLDRAARHLEQILEHQLREFRLDASRLVLVGFGHGGTLALNMSLRQGRICAGVLAYAAKLMRPLPRTITVAHKVRLIECGENRHVGHTSLREDVALLTARGIDARGVVLAGAALSDAAIRHGGAYLVELVATAQRGDRYHEERTTLSSPSGKRARARETGRQP